jgi:hypothetical protein
LRSITLKLKKIFWVVVGFLAVFGLVLWIAEKAALVLAPTYKVGYFLKYSTLVGFSGEWNVATWDQVFVDHRPHDCEWGTAPIGSKHCHYNAVIQTVRTFVDDKGRLMVSYDEGKSSQVASSTREEPAVYVSWAKVTE